MRARRRLPVNPCAAGGARTGLPRGAAGGGWTLPPRAGEGSARGAGPGEAGPGRCRCWYRCGGTCRLRGPGRGGRHRAAPRRETGAGAPTRRPSPSAGFPRPPRPPRPSTPPGCPPSRSRPAAARGHGMKNPLVAPLLLLLVPAARAAPKAGVHGPEVPAATEPDPDPDPLNPELLTLPLLRSAVRSLGPPERDAETLTREQALLYLFVLHDHDRSGRLDGLELLQLLGAVLAQRDGGRPDPDAVAALVDRALERQDLSGDGLLDPPELLLSPGRGRGPPGQPLLQPPGEDAGVGGPAEGQGLPGGGAHPEGQAAPQAEAVEVEEAPEAGAPEGEAPPVWGDPGEG
ncbi:cell growth regulator with EF hand domain protein 1 isoform X2 [Grus americana]|uniref:cell growth regulator with EF hand domain protein 1 isoform X2 n=1 Tax=Grus americana TaxID=9117 RepID=UPI0024079247|nr:cell growth regulator with EF hand domain protein 1 isoform X2 [Grus americana]